MAGEIAAAYIAVLPTMRGFGSQMVAQGGPQIKAAVDRLGAQSGTALGSALGGSAAKAALPAIESINSAITDADRNSQGWMTSSASMAVKNVALYGSMYAAIQGVQVGVSAAFDAMIGFNSQLEQADIGFTTMLKSSSAAQDQMQWIKDFAKESPFQYQDLVGYSQQLVALGFDAEQSRQVLVAAGDAAAGLGRGADGIARINLALGQMWTKGKVQSQEMLQLTEAGVSSWQILADAYGASIEDVQDRVTRGLIDAKTAVPALLAGIEAQFGGLMEKQSTTFQGTWSNTLDTLQQDLAQAGEPLFQELTVDAKAFLAALSDPEVQQILNGVGHELADVASGLFDVGGAAVAGLKDALPLIEGIASNAKTSLPVLAAVAAAYYAIRRAQQGGGITAIDRVVQKSKDAISSIQAVSVAQAGLTAAQQNSSTISATSLAAQGRLNAARIEGTAAVSALAAAERELAAAQAAFAASGVSEIATDQRVEAATIARTAAVERLTLAERAYTEAGLDAALTSKQVAAADSAEAAAAATFGAAQESKVAAVGKLQKTLTKFSGIGQTLGLVGVAAGVTAVGDASAPTEQKVLGVAGALASGALAGASFGIAGGVVGAAAGAAIGGVVGLTAALVNMQQAQDAANKDTSGTAETLTHMGVTADTAAKLMSNLTNAQLEQLGGSQALQKAIQDGGAPYDALIEKIKAMQAAQESLAAASKEQADVAARVGGISTAGLDYQQEKDAADALGAALKALQPAASEAAYSQFLAVEAANAATGSFGEQAEAAYKAALATGAIPPAMLQTGVAAEGAAGRVGYLLSMLTGLPVNTPINFSTNASDIFNQIKNLMAAIAQLKSGTFDQWLVNQKQNQLSALESQLSSALTTNVTASQLTLPSVPSSSSAAAAAVDEAKRAAEEAARQLKADQQAQLQFSDAFGALMKSALEGNFDQYRDKLQDEITSLTRSGYGAAADTLKRLSGTLTQAALDYGALTNKIKSASDAEATLTKRIQDQYQASVDMVTGLGKATDAQSYDQLAYLLGETTSAATQYQSILKALKDQGLSDALWNQLAQAGPQSTGLAQSILAQGQAGIDQLNGLSGSLVDAADSMGTLVSDSMYKQGQDAMKAYIDGLKSQAAALENQLATIGNNILTQSAGAITPGNAGYAPISAAPQQVVNQLDLKISAESLGDIKSVQDFIRMLEQAQTTQLVNQAGTVTS